MATNSEMGTNNNQETTSIVTQPPPKKPRYACLTATTSNVKHEGEETKNVDAICSKTMVVVDPDLLECPICFEPLQSPVYQCNNGHLVCESCLKKIGNTCPSCTFPIGSQRCRVIERIVESATVSCVYKQHGCIEKVSYLKKLDHEKTCEYIPIPCPERVCKYIGSTKCLYTHFAEKHPKSSQPFTFKITKFLDVLSDKTHRFFQERDEKTLFVLHCVTDPLGSLVNVTCVAPTILDMKFSYEVRAKSGDKVISLKSPVELTPECLAHPAKEKCLLVWNDFHELRNGLKRLHLEVVIQKVS